MVKSEPSTGGEKPPWLPRTKQQGHFKSLAYNLQIQMK